MRDWMHFVRRYIAREVIGFGALGKASLTHAGR